jgi:hypothetical protein
MRERPKSRGSFASPALTATYVSLVRPRTHSPNPVQLLHFFSEEFHYPDRLEHFKSEFGLSPFVSSRETGVPQEVEGWRSRC